MFVGRVGVEAPLAQLGRKRKLCMFRQRWCVTAHLREARSRHTRPRCEGSLVARAAGRSRECRCCLQEKERFRRLCAIVCGGVVLRPRPSSCHRVIVSERNVRYGGRGRIAGVGWIRGLRLLIASRGRRTFFQSGRLPVRTLASRPQRPRCTLPSPMTCGNMQGRI